MGLKVGFKPNEVIAISMHAEGAIVLLLTIVEKYTILLVVQGRINYIICYIHTFAQTFTSGLTYCMV